MKEKKRQIAELNDRFWRALAGGKVVMTSGIAALPKQKLEEILRSVKTFDAFDPDDDPYGEHDFGAFKCGEKMTFWKIDYYDAAMAGGSENPADTAETTRVLTIILAEEY